MSEPTAVTTLGMEEIVVSPIFQVREKGLHFNTVSLYTQKLKAGQVLHPVRVVKSRGVFYLYDGFHRIEAMKALGWSEVDAEVTEGDFSEVQILWMAAQANMEHGLPLKAKDYFNAFVAYVKAGENFRVNSSGRRTVLKSYREIGREFGKPHTTIYAWMRRKFPSICKAMTKDFPESTHMGGLRNGSRVDLSGSVTRQALQSVESTFNAIERPEERGEIIRELEETLGRLRASEGWIMEPLEF